MANKYNTIQQIAQGHCKFPWSKNGLIVIGLYQTINSFLRIEGLDTLKCHGQWFDGAGDVAGKDKAL